MIRKGTVDNPITVQEVKKLQNSFIKKLSGGNSRSAQFGIIKDPTYEKKDLVGYGIRYDEQTSSPVEIIRTVEPIHINKLTPAAESTAIGPFQNKEKMRQTIEKKVSNGQSKSMKKLEEQLHNQIDEFAHGNRGGV